LFVRVFVERKEVSHGRGLSIGDSSLLADYACVGGRLRCLREKEVSWSYGVSGALALGLLIYLVVALVRAEDL
jgi:K+-transporting ATPase KdpF subunit